MVKLKSFQTECQCPSVLSPAFNSVPNRSLLKFDVIPDIVVSETDAQKLSCNLKPNKAPGPSNIQAKISKGTADDVVGAMISLY